MKRIKRTVILELIVMAVISIAAYLFASIFDIFETLFELTREYEQSELDEIVVVCLVLSLCFFVLLFRRWREAIHTSRLMDQKNQALQEALDEIQHLKGILPICSNCKKIRDDRGYWHQVEAYIQQYSNAEFSHGICPECMKKLYPEYSDTDGSPADNSP